LEENEGSVPIGKPQAIKRKHKLSQPRSGPSAKAKAVAVAPTAKAVAVAPAGAVAPAEAVDVVAAPALKVSRKCVTSRAYHGAKKVAKDEGKPPAEQLSAAQLAYKTAGAKWDEDNA